MGNEPEYDEEYGDRVSIKKRCSLNLLIALSIWINYGYFVRATQSAALTK
jgi:hypothetical protein